MSFTILIALAAGVAFLLAMLLLVSKGPNRLGKRWMGLFVLALGFAFLEMIVSLGKSGIYFAEFLSLTRYWLAPSLFLAISSFCAIKPEFKWKELWHFVPFVLLLLFRLPFFITGQNQELGDMKLVVLSIVFFSLPVQIIVYWLLCFLKLKRHSGNIRLFSSSLAKSDLRWLWLFVLMTGIMGISWLNLVFLNNTSLLRVTPLVYAICTYLLAYLTLKHGEIFEFSIEQKSDLQSLASTSKPQKRLSDDKISTIRASLESLFETGKPFLEPELTLPSLASRLDVSSNDLSFVINSEYGENFYTYINRYRINYACQLLSSERGVKLNMLGIAFESGFNSKATFNSSFKKQTGQSPTEFLRTL